MQWVHLHPQGGEKIRRDLEGKFTPSTLSKPKAEQECIFRTFFPGRGRFGVGSGSLKKVVNFLERK